LQSADPIEGPWTEDAARYRLIGLSRRSECIRVRNPCRNSTYTIISTRPTGEFNDDLTDHVSDTRVSRQWLVTVDWPISSPLRGFTTLTLQAARWTMRF
jgi:hypothetical protein